METIKFSKIFCGCSWEWWADVYDGRKKVFQSKKELVKYFGFDTVKKVNESFAIGNRGGYFKVPIYQGSFKKLQNA